MRVAMVMPMSPESAIADVMVQAIPELSKHWQLDVWCPAEAAQRPCPVPVIPYVEAGAEVLGDLAAYDLVIYVLGNSPWHSRILPLAQTLPGLVVVHDAALTDLVRHAAIERGELEVLVGQVALDHGDAVAESLRTASPDGGPGGWLRLCDQVPLDGVAVLGSLGVVVHSRWHAARVDGLTLGAVTVAPLPVPSTRLGFEENQDRSSLDLLGGLPPEAMLLVTVGAVNANRRIDLLLEAISDDPALAQRMHLWAVGPSEERVGADLRRHAHRLGIGDHFALTGRVTDALLQDILARADLAASLRDPVLEGQSASVLTQLLSGTPVLVFDHAHYSELPDGVAVKIDPADARRQISAALRALMDDDGERARRGQRGRDYVLLTRHGAAYATALLDAGEKALRARPLAHLTADLATRLRRLGMHRHPAAVDTVTRLAFELYDLA